MCIITNNSPRHPCIYPNHFTTSLTPISPYPQSLLPSLLSTPTAPHILPFSRAHTRALTHHPHTQLPTRAPARAHPHARAQFCVPSPIVFSDVNYLSTTAPPAAAEWANLLRPLRGREPEGIWNLLSIVRELFRRRDRNALALLQVCCSGGAVARGGGGLVIVGVTVVGALMVKLLLWLGWQ